MGQEFFINNQTLENKIRELLPSQGGAGAGFDLSASTQIIPIIDVTESAEGSNLRADLQSSISFKSASVFSVNGSTTDIITTTGYFRVLCGITLLTGGGGTQEANFIINDGSSGKTIHSLRAIGSTQKAITSETIDFIIKVTAGDTFKISTTGDVTVKGSSRQLASITGELTNP